VPDVLGRLPLACPLACPLDGLALAPNGRSLVCERGHVHDVSRHGYVNLLPVQFKPSKAPGDDAAMVAARRRVLDTDLFDPLGDAVAELVVELITWRMRISGSARDLPDGPADGDERTPFLVDAGCGEGSHTARVAARLRERVAGDVHVLGTDISVHAVKAAARRHRDVRWAVANNRRLPVLAGTADVVTSLFGFETWEPWAALQRSGQHVVVGHAGPRHLIELREAIYDDVRIHDPPADAAASVAGYRLDDEHRVTYATNGVSGERIADVLAMTPHGHRASRDTARSLATLVTRSGDDGVALTIDVVLRVHRRS